MVSETQEFFLLSVCFKPLFEGGLVSAEYASASLCLQAVQKGLEREKKEQ